MQVQILGNGAYAPKTILTNHDLEKKIDTSNEWIVARTGIRERHIAAKDEATSDLAVHAARKALEQAGVAPMDVDLVIVATSMPDMFFPSTACIVQEKLGAKNAAAFDLSAACSGFIYALSVGEQYVRSETYRHVLVIGAEVMSRLTNWQDRGTCVLFGDGAGAVLLGPANEGRGILSVHLHTDGALWDLICVPGGAGAIPPSEKVLVECLNTIHMKGSETFKIAVRNLENVALEALHANDMSISDVDWLVPHQANIRILKAVAARLKISKEKMVVNLDRYGNTSAASIPLAFDEAVNDGRIKRGDSILFLAFGGGLTWGAAVVNY
ncbi:3-oxoacyl-[acyl-carrier-protein] synthase, KASIII [hydrothermal vent metagenome]|uniref:beta-ketoacyl-[acyl-carrier-protein] synthase III n=1 Tax=hydrothermal vent metagenome TaxID=652676 RepID=A0A3B1CEX2_9ZZZZ